MDSKRLSQHNSIFLFVILLSLSTAAPGIFLSQNILPMRILYLVFLLGSTILLLLHIHSDIVNRASYFIVQYRNNTDSYHLLLLMISCLLWSIFIILPTWPAGKSSAIQLSVFMLILSTLAYLHFAGRRLQMQIDRTIIFLISILLIMLLFSLIYPVIYEARGKSWENALDSLGKSRQQLTYLETFYQLNTDITGWIDIASFFTHHYYTEKSRVNRPIYPAIISTFCRVADGFKRYPKQISQTCGEYTVFIVGILVNTSLTIVALMFWVNLLRGYIANDSVIFLSGLAMVTSPHILWSLPQTSTNIIGLCIVVFTVWIFARILQTQHLSFTSLLTYSLIYGILMLTKSNYSTLLVFLLVVLFYRHRWMSVSLFLILHFIPLLTWIAILQQAGLEYYNHEVAVYRQGVWVFEEFIYFRPQQMYHYVVSFLEGFVASSIFAFGLLVLTLLAYSLLKPSIAAGHRWIVMATVVGVAMFTFLLRRSPPFLVFDSYFSVLPAAAVGLWELIEQLQRRMIPMQRHNAGMIVAVIVVLLNNFVAILASNPQFNLAS